MFYFVNKFFFFAFCFFCFVFFFKILEYIGGEEHLPIFIPSIVEMLNEIQNTSFRIGCNSRAIIMFGILSPDHHCCGILTNIGQGKNKYRDVFSISHQDEWVTNPFKTQRYLLNLEEHEKRRKEVSKLREEWEKKPKSGQNKRVSKKIFEKDIASRFGNFKGKNLFHGNGLKSDGKNILLCPPSLHNLSFWNKTALNCALEIYPNLKCMGEWRRCNESLAGNIAVGNLVASFGSVRRIVCL